MQRVARRESCLTPVATPAGHADDDRLGVIGSHEVANRTGSIVHEIDRKAYDEATPSTETLQRPTVPLGSTDTGSRLDPLVTTDEHLDRPNELETSPLDPGERRDKPLSYRAD